MEQTAPVTRKRRKRAHPTKCPCCSDDRGKPEKEPRRRRREDNDTLPDSSTVDGNERLLDLEGTKLSEGDKPSSGNATDENITNERRILRSGRNTPVSLEVVKSSCTSKSKEPSKFVKRRLGSQKGSRNGNKSKKTSKKTAHDSTVSSPDGFMLSPDRFSNNSQSKIMQHGRAKDKIYRKPNRCGISSSVVEESELNDSILFHHESYEKEKGKNKKKLPVKNNNLSKQKHIKLIAGNRLPTAKKKTLAIERLKIRSFDNLKEKIEIAIGKSPITVPECVELLGKITSVKLKHILGDHLSSPNQGSSGELGLYGDLTEERTESGSETQTVHNELAENMNESEAAKALVSFKVQTAVSSSSGQIQMNVSSQEIPTTKQETLSLVRQKTSVTDGNTKSLQSNLIATPAAGLPLFSSSDQTFRKTEIPITAPVVIPSGLPTVSVVQTPVTFQLLQVPSQGNNQPRDLTTTPLQQTSGFPYQKPTTILNNLITTPAPGSQQSNQIFPTPFNQLLYVAKVKQQNEQKSIFSPNFPGILPAGMKIQDQTLQTTAFPNVTWSTSGTNLVNSSTSSLCPVSTSTAEVQSSIKLRPILPREPVVSANFPLFGQSRAESSAANPLPKMADQSSNVKQAVKKLVNERTKMNDSSIPQVPTSLPDIASTFRKSSFPTPSNLESCNREGMLYVKPDLRDCTEMTSKEQAIKALLSIGGNENLTHHEAGDMAGLGNRSYETNENSELKVVFDTDKGIFKVDDVTIDPQVNTISKESYTCGKCGKIFTSLSYLARHIKRVCPDMTQRKWKCNHCDKAFRHPFGLQQHVYTHTGERPHKCPQCPKAFYSSNDLRRHSRIHSGERPYKCKHCGKSFATTISLKTHTFIHTGEKPHRCPHCPKTFATSSKLGRHIVTHSEQRPYSCSQCPKTFNRSGDLRRHSVHVHNAKLTDNADRGQDKEKIYRCTECSGSFDTPKELGAHITEHTTETGLVDDL